MAMICCYCSSQHNITHVLSCGHYFWCQTCSSERLRQLTTYPCAMCQTLRNITTVNTTERTFAPPLSFGQFNSAEQLERARVYQIEQEYRLRLQQQALAAGSPNFPSSSRSATVFENSASSSTPNLSFLSQILRGPSAFPVRPECPNSFMSQMQFGMFLPRACMIPDCRCGRPLGSLNRPGSLSEFPMSELNPNMERFFATMREMNSNMQQPANNAGENTENPAPENLTVDQTKTASSQPNPNDESKNAESKPSTSSTDGSEISSCDNPKLCCVCLDKEKDTAFVPCGHKCVCLECAGNIFLKYRECPLCQSASLTYLRIYS